jgi:hypothetical protein
MLVVVVTANHFWLDGVAAAGLLVVAMAVVAAIERLRVRQAVQRLYRPAAPDAAVLTVEEDGLLEAAVTRDRAG